MTSCAVYGCVACAVDGSGKCAVHKKHDAATVYEPIATKAQPLLDAIRERLSPLIKHKKPFRGGGVSCPGCGGTGSYTVDCEGCNGMGTISIDEFLTLVEEAIDSADDVASKAVAS